MSLKSIDDVHGSDGLSSGVLSVSDRVSDDVFKENLQDTSGLFVDESGDSLDSSSSGQSSDGRLGDTLDVISQNLSVSLGTSLSQTFSSFSSSCGGGGDNEREIRRKKAS